MCDDSAQPDEAGRCKPKGMKMQFTDWKIVSQSKNGRKAMIISHRGKGKNHRSVTRHCIRRNNVWVYERFRKEMRGDQEVEVRIIFEEFITEEQKLLREKLEKKNASEEEHENDADMALAHEEGN